MSVKNISKGIAVLLLAVSPLFAKDVMAQETNIDRKESPDKQELKQPTLEDLIPGGETYRRIENRWYDWYADAACLELDIDRIEGFWTKTKSKETFTVITLEEANKLLEKKGLGKLHHFYLAKALNMPSITTAIEPKPATLILVNTGRNRAIIDWKKKEILWSQPCPAGTGNEDWNQVSRNLAYTIENNLYVMNANGDIDQVTNESKGIICGQSVHRNEFGISKGTFWSPSGTQLAFYRMDERMVTEYPLVDITARVGEVNPIRYPMAGMTSHKVQVGIYSPSTQNTIYLNTGDPTDRYFTNISWAPDEKSIYLIELNRDQNHSKLCQYNAETGELMAILIEETHPKYVEPQNPILFLPWDSSKFIYQSQYDGYNHLYLCDLKADDKNIKSPFRAEEVLPPNGTGITAHLVMKQLTSGNWLVKELLGFNTRKKEIIFIATKESPMQSNIYKVNVNNSKITLLDNGEGVHRATLSAGGEYFIDNYSTPEIPRSINLTTVQSGKSLNLLTASNPYKGFKMPNIETGTLKAADGKTDLYYRIIKPADFDPTKKYPAIIYVYGGPHAQMITNGWMHDARGWDLYMANKGYIMFSLDNRGSSNRGLEFENTTFRQLGIEECKDQVKGAEFLKSLPYIEENCIGVHGWSFGGHMTTALLLRYPEIFKVGVAGGPVIDWGYYEVMYGERYMDTPQTNPEGYKTCNLNNFAGNLKGHLLIIHDDHDDTCVPQHTLSFMKACVDARTYPDLFIYPNHKHNVMGRDRVHLHEKITRYFDDYLKRQK